jgi:hypothetical protein
MGRAPAAARGCRERVPGHPEPRARGGRVCGSGRGPQEPRDIGAEAGRARLVSDVVPQPNPRHADVPTWISRSSRGRCPRGPLLALL